MYYGDLKRALRYYNEYMVRLEKGLVQRRCTFRLDVLDRRAQNTEQRAEEECEENKEERKQVHEQSPCVDSS